MLKVRPHTKSGGGGGSPLQVRYTKSGGGQSTSGPIYEKWRGGVYIRSDIRKVGGGGGQFASGPIGKVRGRGGGGGGASPLQVRLVSSPDPDSQQLRVDYITATCGDVIHPQLLGIWVWGRD